MEIDLNTLSPQQRWTLFGLILGCTTPTPPTHTGSTIDDLSAMVDRVLAPHVKTPQLCECGRPAEWKCGICGDVPICALCSYDTYGNRVKFGICGKCCDICLEENAPFMRQGFGVIEGGK